MLRILLLTTFIHLTLFGLEQNDLKAVFLERFTRFIEWPVQSTLHQETTFNVCVINDTDFAKTLKNIYANKTIKNRPVNVINILENSNKKRCSLLYIGNSEHVSNLVSEAKKYHILTVSHNETFGSEGVMINFYLDQQRMRYEINNHSAKESDLSISYLLLKSARLIPLKSIQ